MSELGRYRKLYVRLWRHPGFLALTGSEKLLALYLLTGPQTNRLGVYPWSPGLATADLGLSTKTVQRGQDRLQAVFDWAVTCPPPVLEIPSWFTWNPPPNRSVVTAILKDLNEIPACPARDRARARLAAWLTPCPTPCPTPCATSGTGSGAGTGSGTDEEKTRPVEIVENSARADRGPAEHDRAEKGQ